MKQYRNGDRSANGAPPASSTPGAGKRTRTQQRYGAVIQRRPASDGGAPATGWTPISGPGAAPRDGSAEAMPAQVQQRMEGSFGHDFSTVRIHEDSTDALALGAQAFTHGDDIHFAPGTYQPGSDAGDELLGHELTHVVQQRAGQAGTQAKGAAGEAAINADAALEAEADRAGARAARGQPVQVAGVAAGLQRKELDSATLTKALESIPRFKEMGAKTLAQGMTLQQHIDAVLSRFDTHFKDNDEARNEIMRIAAVISNVAREIARSIHDPTLGPTLAKKIVEAYRADLSKLLRKARTGDPTDKTALSDGEQKELGAKLDTVAALVGDDPLHLYMTGKVPLVDAAWRIRDMAREVAALPEDFFAMLKAQFLMEYSAYDRAQVGAGTKKKDTITEVDAQTGQKKQGAAGFELGDLYGEIDNDVFFWLFEIDGASGKVQTDTAGPMLKSTPRSSGTGYQKQDSPVGRLDALETAVSDKNLKPVKATATELATEKARSGDKPSDAVREHFIRLDREEQVEKATTNPKNGKTPEQELDDWVAARYGVSPGRAHSLVGKLVDLIKAAPLTITASADRLFASRPDGASEPLHGSAYKSEQVLAQKEHEVKDLVGADVDGTVTALGHDQGGYVEGRGLNYMRWRREKDERETGYHGLGAEDLPIFGALNPNFTKLRGGNANLAEYDAAKGKYGDKGQYGENYYGDMHMVLKPEVLARSVLIARGKQSVPGRRIERRDMTLLLHDMFRLRMFDYLDELMTSAIGSDKTVITNMDAEIHVYGGLDLKSDVASVWVASSVFKAKAGTGKRIRDFCSANGIALQDIGKKPRGLKVHAPSGMKGGVDFATKEKKKQLAKA